MWNWRRKKQSEWVIVRGEDLVLEMPSTPRVSQTSTTRHGEPLQIASRVALAPSNSSCHLTIRSGPFVDGKTDNWLFDDWVTEFEEALFSTEFAYVQRENHPVAGEPHVRAVKYSCDDYDITALARLLREPERMVIFVSIGPTALVDKLMSRMFESYRASA